MEWNADPDDSNCVDSDFDYGVDALLHEIDSADEGDIPWTFLFVLIERVFNLPVVTDAAPFVVAAAIAFVAFGELVAADAFAAAASLAAAEPWTVVD